jgi:hypothetical protein
MADKVLGVRGSEPVSKHWAKRVIMRSGLGGMAAWVVEYVTRNAIVVKDIK